MKRKILITGVSGNLGKAVAERYLLSGDTVIGVYSPGKTMVAGDIIPYEANLEDEAAATTAFAKIVAEQNRLDIAVLTVGGFAQGNLEDTNWSAVQRMIDLNLKTCYHLARQAFAHMKSAGGGRIVLIGAKPALDASEGIGLVAYVLGKSLVFKLAELLNAEGKKYNVVCSVIVPGVIDTPANRQANPHAMFDNWVTPEAIAGAIHYLTSNDGASLREPVLKMYGNA